MKKIIVLVSLLSIVMFQSCKKHESPGDNFDFSNSLPPYVTIKDLSDIDAAPGDVVTVDLQLRTSIQQKITITYKVEGAVTVASGTAEIAKESKAGTVKFTIPAGAATPSTATFTLLKAQTEDGKALTIGQNADAAGQKVKVLIDKPVEE
ncbi:hypothetical protein [Pedobacter foliorum]|uniref:hypothetical protein n=1 Tax=Pedobacter foliorum TaxID=2739058 RepID=UPI001565C4CF|nr:hypothetical protein [Pedobacter foliorum]NRF38520.1 hypothetical protein [Pedobacter foliorum]